MDPRRPLAAAQRVLAAPLRQIVPTLSAELAGFVPHRALAMLTGDCVRSPLWTCGDPELTAQLTSAELAKLAGTVDVGRQWVGVTRLAGADRLVLAAASAPPGSAGGLLVLVLDAPPGELETELTSQLWEVTMARIVALLPESEPVYLAEHRAATTERARVAAELGDQHALTLTALLGTLRAGALDDGAARRLATEQAVSALLELRAADRDRGEEEAGAAFGRLAEKLSLLSRYSDVVLELVGPDHPGRRLPGDLADAARSTVRGAILAMLEQGGVGRIRVAWRLDDAALLVTVRDDGPGTLAGGLAVHRLADRLASLDGALTVDAVPGWGTTVTGTLPLTAPGVADLPPAQLLNPRELDVYQHLVGGRRNRQIAERLHISEHTVKFHVANILAKLGVASRGEAAALARQG